LVAKHAVFIAISEYMKNVIEQRWKARRIELIPNPIDTNMFKPLKVTFSINGFPKLLFVGALRPVKGVDTLISTMKYLIKKYPRSKLFIVGDGNVTKYVKLSRTLGVMDNIIFVGRLSPQELIYMYNMCDIFITASYWESFCRPIVEAMSCGKPVVCRDAYACSEHIRNSGAAVGFKSDNPDEIIWAIEEVLKNYNQMCENARRYALKFESSKIAEKWFHLYKLLAGV
jgi:1,2-diacylglycerol 3-alpha-glucosyltransferase